MQYTIEQKRPYQRLVIPVALIFLIFVSALVADYLSLTVGVNLTVLIAIFKKLYFLLLIVSIGLGVYIVLPAAYFAGASLSERFAAAFFTPVVMIGYIVCNGLLVFSGWDLFHWCTQPILTGIAALAAFNIGITEMICRLIHKKKQPSDLNIFDRYILLMILSGLILLFFGYAVVARSLLDRFIYGYLSFLF